MKVFLDTNVLASALATRGLCADVLRLTIAEHKLLLSEHVLSELEDVLAAKFGLRESTIADTLAFLRTYLAAAPKGDPAGVSVSDPADAQIVADAIGAGAEAFVTGDKELLKLKSRVPLSVLSPREFWGVHRRR